ncbi:MAG: hypothetical protein M1826_005927 [Phylliscum demangeonii]|nr:MAG: hypothetical protein M1826_005927 [Phylliscum demangeonii]
MCRVAKVYFNRCAHSIRVEMRGWCNGDRRGWRTDGVICRKTFRLQVKRSICEWCAVRQARAHVDKLRDQLCELEELVRFNRPFPDSFDREAFRDACLKIMASLRKYRSLVTKYNERGPQLFNLLNGEVDDDEGDDDESDDDESDDESDESDDDEANDEPPGEAPRLMELRYHDPLPWIIAYRQRARSVSRHLLHPDQPTPGWRGPGMRIPRWYGRSDDDDLTDMVDRWVDRGRPRSSDYFWLAPLGWGSPVSEDGPGEGGGGSSNQ